MDKLNRKAGMQIKQWLFRRKALILTGERQVGKTTMLRDLFSKENEVLWLNADEGPVRERLSELSIPILQQVWVPIAYSSLTRFNGLRTPGYY